MYYRVTTYSFDAARRDEFLEFADSLRDELKAIDGTGNRALLREIGEGEGMIVARYASGAAADERNRKSKDSLAAWRPF